MCDTALPLGTIVVILLILTLIRLKHYTPYPGGEGVGFRPEKSERRRRRRRIRSRR
jgi:hypothetical protein